MARLSLASRATWLAAALALGGCASTVPSFDLPRNAGGPTVSTIKQEIICELDHIVDGKAFTQYLGAAYDVNVAILLNLDVTDDGALAPTAAYLAGPFLLGGGLGYEQSREQNFQEQLAFSFSELRATLDTIRKTDPAYSLPDCGRNPGTNLAGDLGLKAAWDLALTGLPNVNWAGAAPVGAFGGTVTFTVKKQITATGPTWTLEHFVGPGPFAKAYENNVDKLTFAFVQGPRAKKDKALGSQAAAKFLDTVLQGAISTTLTNIQNKN